MACSILMADSLSTCSQPSPDVTSTTSFLRQSLTRRSSIPPLSDCSSSSSSDDDEVSFAASVSQPPPAQMPLDLDSSEPLSFVQLRSEARASSPARLGSSYPCSPFASATQQPALCSVSTLNAAQLDLISTERSTSVTSSFLQAEPAEVSGQQDTSNCQFTQPLLWMSYNCHWMRDNAGVVASPARQQLELADYVTVPTSVTYVTNTPMSAEAQSRGIGGLSSEDVPPEWLHITKLLPQHPGMQRRDPHLMHQGGCRDSCEAIELHERAEATCATLVSALLRKSRECENLATVVRELTASRARGAGAKIVLQERCSLLLSDVARLQRVAAAARRGQIASVKAMQSANAAKLEAECRVACLQQQKLAVGEARGDVEAVGSCSPCSSSMRRIGSAASVHSTGNGHQLEEVLCFGVSC